MDQTLNPTEVNFTDPFASDLIWVAGCEPPTGSFGHTSIEHPTGAVYVGGWNEHGAHGVGVICITRSVDWVSRWGKFRNGTPLGKHVYTKQNGARFERYYNSGRLVSERAMNPEICIGNHLPPSSLTDERYLPLPQHRIQRQFKYRSSTYDFREVVYKIFRCATLTGGGTLPDVLPGTIGREMERLHQHQAQYSGRTNTSPLHKIFMCITSLHAVDMQREKHPHYAALHMEFKGLLKRFVREVVAPLLSCGPDDVLYQKIPALRIAEPSEQALGHRHIDYEYNHQPSEVNFWIPLTDVSAENSLFIESLPGAEDYTPVVAGYGDAVRFWGNQCRHHTVANTTETTRVSLDFRCIARDKYNAKFVDSRGKINGFRVPHYYVESREMGATGPSG